MIQILIDCQVNHDLFSTEPNIIYIAVLNELSLARVKII